MSTNNTAITELQAILGEAGYKRDNIEPVELERENRKCRLLY